jgi:hypothetical protein
MISALSYTDRPTIRRLAFASRASLSSKRDEWVSFRVLRVLRVATWCTAEALNSSVRMGSAGESGWIRFLFSGFPAL